MTEFDAVFFDIGGVLLDLSSVREGHDEFIRLLADAHDITDHDAAKAEWRGALSAYFSQTEGTDYRPAAAGYQHAVDELLGQAVPESAWKPLFEEATYGTIRPHDGAKETLAALDDAGVYLGVVSDVDDHEGKRILETLDLHAHFDHVTTSEAVGKKKPDQAMFQTALDHAGVSPETGLMVGDRYSHDMVGGREAGLTTVAYGANDGPAVDYVISDLREILRIVGVRE
ncbi:MULTISPECIES: HAD family hydrolase [unclassified Haladaptatus]|uniref:HAD family hydrolase n=1 Tax=unclassified Haladaptatus TaxID=2622732 RepID=UPI0023E85FDE|nr:MULTISPECIES: HAD family hydrolase [unclassified Haladaptatus]